MSIEKYNKVRQKNEYILLSNGTKSRWQVKNIPSSHNDFSVEAKLIDLLKKLFGKYPATTFKLLSCYRKSRSTSQHSISTAMDLQVKSGNKTQEQIVCEIEDWIEIKGIGLYDYSIKSELPHKHFHIDVRSKSKQRWYQPKRNDSTRKYLGNRSIRSHMKKLDKDPL